MLNDLSILAVPPLRGSGDTAVPQRPPASAATPAPETAQPGKLYANPDFHFDPAAGLVVIEFRNESGKVTNTIPTQRQLDAYRSHQDAPGDAPGDTPALKSPDGTASTG